MGRAKGLYVLSLSSLGCGLIVDVATSRRPELFVLANVLLLCGAAACVCLLVLLRGSCRSFLDQFRESGSRGLLSQIHIPATGIPFLTRAWRVLVEAAVREVESARLSAKDLEIRLRIAQAERQHAEAILYSISDAVLVTDPFDDLVLANESAARAFDFDLTKAPRSSLDILLGDSQMVTMIREMRQSHSRSGRRVVEHQHTANGVRRTYKVTLSNIDGGGARAGVVAILHDVTREKEVSEMKNDFVSMVSHELRTPLASIRAYVEMLIDGEADDAKTRGEFYEVIQNESNRLGRLIDNILNISRIESGLLRINKQPQSLSVIARDAMEVIAPQAQQKKIVVHQDLAAPIYQTVADRDMIYQAMLNLMSNAVKYTPEAGQITVQVLVDEQKKKVLTLISDTGVGIPPKDLPFVFDKFFRAEANNKMAAGTGLGLSVVKHIIETVHRGRLFLESHVGKGSCFGFEMDLCE